MKSNIKQTATYHHDFYVWTQHQPAKWGSSWMRTIKEQQNRMTAVEIIDCHFGPYNE